MKPTENTKKIAYTALTLAVCAFIVPGIVGFFVVFLSRGLPLPLYFLSFLLGIGPLLALIAVFLGHRARKGIKEAPLLPGSGQALAGLILGYIVLAHSLFALGFGFWFSHSMKDFH